MVGQGLHEDQVRTFLEEKGAYCMDQEIMAHNIKQGHFYERPLGADFQEINLS